MTAALEKVELITVNAVEEVRDWNTAAPDVLESARLRVSKVQLSMETVQRAVGGMRRKEQFALLLSFERYVVVGVETVFDNWSSDSIVMFVSVISVSCVDTTVIGEQTDERVFGREVSVRDSLPEERRIKGTAKDTSVSRLTEQLSTAKADEETWKNATESSAREERRMKRPVTEAFLQFTVEERRRVGVGRSAEQVSVEFSRVSSSFT